MSPTRLSLNTNIFLVMTFLKEIISEFFKSARQFHVRLQFKGWFRLLLTFADYISILCSNLPLSIALEPLFMLHATPVPSKLLSTASIKKIWNLVTWVTQDSSYLGPSKTMPCFSPAPGAVCQKFSCSFVPSYTSWAALGAQQNQNFFKMKAILSIAGT